MQNRSGRTVTRGSKSRLQSLAYQEVFWEHNASPAPKSQAGRSCIYAWKKKRGGNLSRSRMTRRGETNVTGILVPPPRPRLLDVPTVSRVRANTGVFASNVKQRTRVAFEQTDNLYLETDWPVSFQLRLSFVRISFGGFFYRSVEFSWRGLCASSRSCRLSRWNSRTSPAGVYAAN